jgi:mono/diheme cytochrome c family protein
MKKPLKIVLASLAVLVLVIGAGYVWAAMKASGLRSAIVETHKVDFPIPVPLTEAELAELGPEDDPDALARERAIERGRHLVQSRYVCTECHGTNFGGGVMVDDPMIGRLLGPNITTGSGSKTVDYEPSDWDRAVRHGVLKGGTPSAMPAEDFQRMSDQELSDVVTFIRSMPPVDNEVPPIRLGPLGTVLVAAGQLPFAAYTIPSHDQPHAVLPPDAEVSAEFGQHLAGVCTGCHGANLAGGPIPGGDPSWVPARNLTPHSDGLAGWSYEDFLAAITEGTRPDGTALLEPMTLVLPYARNMTEVETRALWAYLESVPAVASPE